jgi:hypothetical protein
MLPHLINKLKPMLIVEVKESGSIERALKILKKKFESTGTLKDLRDRKVIPTSPSDIYFNVAFNRLHDQQIFYRED